MLSWSAEQQWPHALFLVHQPFLVDATGAIFHRKFNGYVCYFFGMAFFQIIALIQQFYKQENNIE